MRNDPSCTSYELTCGHDVMIDLPKETASIIERAYESRISDSAALSENLHANL